ncbi:MAG: rhomboid family intramembrane serine protease [Edaphocola sp.]
MSMTVIIIAVTVIVSLLGFGNRRLLDALLLWPAAMNGPSQCYRFLTAGFVHADYMHLGFNMFSLYFFAVLVEQFIGRERLIILYLLGIIVSCVPSFFKQRHRPGYRSLGASGGVAAVIFASIYLSPWDKVYVFFAIGLPSIVFAVVYLAYTAYLARRGGGIVNHDAHLWGSIFGLLFMLVIDPTHGGYLINQLMHPPFSTT